MRRKLAALLMLTLAGGLFVSIRAAEAHECPRQYSPNDPSCKETRVYGDWRDNYVPLFDLTDRDDGAGNGQQQRRDAQRWRDECEDAGEYRQQCAWYYGGNSAVFYEGDDGHDGHDHETPEPGLSRPNEAHVGYAATHCFLAEGAHDCDRHGRGEFDTHDSHGGALYADVCITDYQASERCDDGLADTQAGVTIVDHLDCPLGCFDEYHVVRPLDTAYTEEQMTDSADAVTRISGDPQTQVCGSPREGNYCGEGQGG